MFSRLSSDLSEESSEAASLSAAYGRKRRTGVLRIVAHMGRLRTAPALLTPVAWGVAMARWQQTTISIWWGLAILLCFGALALACSFLGPFVDFLRHARLEGSPPPPTKAEQKERLARAQLFDGYDWMQQGLLRPGSFLSLGLIAATIYLLASIWLGFFIGWPFWFFALVAGLLGAASIWPVLRYSRRLWWLGELAFWLGMGVVPLAGAYFVLTGALSRTVLLVSLAPATFAWLSHHAYGFYSWHRDWRLRKRTLAVVLGPERGLDVAAILAIAGFIVLLLLIATSAVPVWTIVVLGAFPLFLRAFARSRVWPSSRQAGIATVEQASDAVALAGLLWLVPLWLV